MIRDKIETERYTLYLGDCASVLPTIAPGSVDAVVTDPPYGLGERWNGGAGGKKSSWRIPSSEAKKWDMQINPVVDSLPTYGTCIIWGGNYYRLPPSRCWLIWDKKQPDNWTTGQAELAWTSLDRPIRTFRMAACEAHSTMNKKHPAQKPIELMVWCFKWIGGDIILDPFMGSGTTGVAAMKLGRRFIGVEIDEKYFVIAHKRIAEAAEEPPLFKAAREAEQATLFEGAQ